ncbi:MAG: riboflavin synthase, partial [Saprospiraceae bacterium]|nr:riboflavin synthase [Saprospiraceae bacterium]
MFTGIIECQGLVLEVRSEGSNKDFIVQSPISSQFKVDQSVCHNGVCLTVVELGSDWHRVTAIEETFSRSNLGDLKKGDQVNLERSMTMDSLLDGHVVQGHV